MRIFLLGCIALGLGCGQDQGFHGIDGYWNGATQWLEGRVCDPSTGTWLEGATVYSHLFDTSGFHYKTVQATTDVEGWWSLEGLHAGQTHTVFVQYGSDIIDMFDIEMPEAAGVVLAEPNCVGDDVRVAVVSGDYDDFATLLPELGIGDFEIINGQTGEDLVQFLSSPENLAAYEMVFFDGGHLEEDVVYDTDGNDTAGIVPSVQLALAQYVRNGGTLYVTDWSYDLIEQIWPEMVDFLGDDTVPDDAQRGEPELVEAQVVHPGLSNSLGVDSLSIDFDMAVWPPVISTADEVTVFLRGDVHSRDGMSVSSHGSSALLLQFDSGDGSVVFCPWRHTSNNEGDALEVVRYMFSQLTAAD
jgi:hypothetical protein